jgi:hypothetical protein
MPSWFAKLLELLLGCHLFQVGENRLHARTYVRSDPRAAAHPSGLEEVEGYKNIFVFSQIPDLSFQEVDG